MQDFEIRGLEVDDERPAEMGERAGDPIRRVFKLARRRNRGGRRPVAEAVGDRRAGRRRIRAGGRAVGLRGSWREHVGERRLEQLRTAADGLRVGPVAQGKPVAGAAELSAGPRADDVHVELERHRASRLAAEVERDHLVAERRPAAAARASVDRVNLHVRKGPRLVVDVLIEDTLEVEEQFAAAVVDGFLHGVTRVAGGRWVETLEPEAVDLLVGESVRGRRAVLVRHRRVHQRRLCLRGRARAEAELEPVAGVPGVAKYDVERDLHRPGWQGAHVERDGLVAEAE